MEKDLKTLVDLGGHCYVQAIIPDTEFVFVNCGLGFNLQMTKNEALAFIEKQDKLLQQSVDRLTQRANFIKENIQYLLTYIHNLKQKNKR
jgi:prefoldin subunit 5